MERLAADARQAGIAHLGHLVGSVHGAEPDVHPRTQHPVHDPHARDGTQVLVVEGVEDERAQRPLRVSRGRRHPLDDRFQDFRRPGAFLGARKQHGVGIHPEEVRQLVAAALGLSAGKVDLVHHGNHFQVRIQREKEVGDGLGLDALARVDDEDGAFAGGQRARHLVGEVDVSGSVDQVELVALPIARGVVHAHRVQLDGDAPFALQFVGVEHLGAHLAGGRGRR